MCILVQQDLLRQWSYPALIIATRFSQVYQQTRSLGYSRCRITRHGSWLKKKKEEKKKTRSRNTASQGTSLGTSKIPLSVQDCNSCLPPFWRVFTSYLSSSLCTYEPSRSIPSSNEKLLKIPKRNLKSFGQRSFSFMAPSLWNCLPDTLRNVPTLSQFKSHLKKLLVCPGLPVESEERCVCVWQLDVDGYIWIGRGGREWGRERTWEIEAREGGTGWVGEKRDSNWYRCLRSLIFC